MTSLCCFTPVFLLRFYDYVRRPLTARQLYNEMILQRVAQGFQLVILSKKQMPISDIVTPTSKLIRAQSMPPVR